MRTRLLQVVTTLVLLALVVACGSGDGTATPTPTATSAPGATSEPSSDWDQIVQAARAEGTLKIYGTGSLRGAEGAQIAEEFRRAYGITIEQVAGAGSPTYQRIQQELQSGVPSADVVFLSPPWQGTFEEAGLYESLDGKALPVFEEPESVWKLHPLALSESKSYVMVRPSYPNGHVMVNASLLPEADYPTSFTQLATDPKYRNKIVWVDPQTTQDIAFKWALWGYVANALSLEDLWTIYANQDPFLVPDPTREADAITSGQGVIAMGLAGFEGVASAGAPIALLQFPDLPTVSNVDTLGLVRDAEHPNAALVFINWILSKEGQQALSEIGHYRTVRTDVPDGLPGPLAQSIVTGSGNPGPEYIVTAKQALLPSFIHEDANDAWLGLTRGISQSDFVSAINAAVEKWEAENGQHREGLALR